MDNLKTAFSEKKVQSVELLISMKIPSSCKKFNVMFIVFSTFLLNEPLNTFPLNERV